MPPTTTSRLSTRNAVANPWIPGNCTDGKFTKLVSCLPNVNLISHRTGLEGLPSEVFKEIQGVIDCGTPLTPDRIQDSSELWLLHLIADLPNIIVDRVPSKRLAWACRVLVQTVPECSRTPKLLANAKQLANEDELKGPVQLDHLFNAVRASLRGSGEMKAFVERWEPPAWYGL